VTDETSERAETSSLVVALAGAPNAGKSTLLNRILGRTLSIATPKPQTTRTRVLGVHALAGTQLVFTDTPGIHAASGPLHERMVDAARAGVRAADLTCWLVAADRGVTPTDREELTSLASRALVVAINKIDRVEKPRLLPLIDAVSHVAAQAEIFPISARSGEGVQALLAYLVAHALPGPWLYPADTLTDKPVRFFVAELVREQLFVQLAEELPYRIAVKVDTFEERRPKTYIQATIYTDRDSTKKIIIGREGARIKEIGRRARRAIEDFLGAAVFLELHVRVHKDWQNDPRFLEDVGL
jgi:GTP-binding protein Era